MRSLPTTVPIAIEFADGTVGIMQFVTQQPVTNDTLTKPPPIVPANQDNVDAAIDKSEFGPGKKPVRGWQLLTSLTDVPQDRVFRDAWRLRAGRVIVDMPLARTIHMDRIRARRNKKLAELDIEWSRAVAQDRQADAVAIEQQRQSLRDLPQTFDLSVATTPDELKILWPSALV